MSFGPPYLDRRNQSLNIGDVVVMIKHPCEGQFGTITHRSPTQGVCLIPGIGPASYVWRWPKNVELYYDKDLVMDEGL